MARPVSITKEYEGVLIGLWDSADALEAAVRSDLDSYTGYDLEYSHYVLAELQDRKDKLTEDLFEGTFTPVSSILEYDEWLETQ